MTIGFDGSVPFAMTMATFPDGKLLNGIAARGKSRNKSVKRTGVERGWFFWKARSRPPLTSVRYALSLKEKTMDKEFIGLKLEKRSFSVMSLSDQSDDKYYWFSRTPIERFQQIEILRRINYGHRATSRLQRVLEFTEG